MRTTRWVAFATVQLLACGAEAQPRGGSAPTPDDTLEGELVRPDVTLVRRRPAGPLSLSDPDAVIDALSRAAERGDATDAQLLRLAQVLADRAANRRRDGYRAMEAAHRAEAASEAGARERETRAMDRALAEARRDEGRAVELLRRISSGADRRLRARALADEMYLSALLERPAEGRAAAEQLLRLCPTCPQAAGAHLALGEHAFEQGDMEAAIGRYARVLDVPDASPGDRAYALYKQGWAQLNLGRFDKAWSAIDAARREAASAGETGRLLRREATRDLVRVTALRYVDTPTALDLLARIADGPAERQALGDRYEQLLRDHGRLSDADDFAAARGAGPGD